MSAKPDKRLIGWSLKVANWCLYILFYVLVLLPMSGIEKWVLVILTIVAFTSLSMAISEICMRGDE